MDKILAKAISKACEKVADGLSLAQGKHTVDQVVTLHVHGTVSKAADSMATPTVSLPHKAVLGFFLEKLGAVSVNVEALLVEAMQEALKAGEKAEAAVSARIKDIEAAEARVVAALGELPKQPRKGAVTVRCEVEEVALQTA